MRKTIALMVMLLAFTAWSAAQYAQNLQVTNGPSVERVGDSSAVISWTTNMPAATTLRYGTDAENLDQAVQAPGRGIEHRVRINNLEPNQDYFFQVQTNRTRFARSVPLSDVQRFQTSSENAYRRDQYGNGYGRDQYAYGRDQYGRDQYGQRQYGLPQSDQYGNSYAQQNQAVQITNGPTVESVTPRSAVVAWSTNANSSTVLRYGTDRNNLGQMAEAPWGARTHRVTISNLQPGTTYYYRIESGQGQGTGTTATSDVQQFQTSGGAASTSQGGFISGRSAQKSIITSGLTIRRADANSAVVEWLTSVPASAIVRYGTDPNNMSQMAESPWGGTTHTVTLTGLQPNTRYFFQVKSGDAEGQGTSSYSQPFTFTTPAAGAAPITNVQATRAQ
jgi:phosphodiesterase/alkaline phosphatase D-like protein